MIDFDELWRYRELLYRLLWRDVKARYKQTVLGPLWAVLRPLISMILMAAVFGGLAGFKSGSGVPYPLFVFVGMLVWTYFSSAVTSASSSIANNGAMLSKIYFPRLYAPLAAVTAPLVDFALSLTIAVGLFAWFHRWPTWHIVFMPFFVLLALLTGLGIGMWLTGAMVKYRDVGFTLPYIIGVGIYATPILYPVSKLPEPYRSLIALNPLTAVVDGFRWSLLGVASPNLGILGVSTAVAVLVSVTGLFYFRRVERTIVDLT